MSALFAWWLAAKLAYLKLKGTAGGGSTLSVAASKETPKMSVILPVFALRSGGL
jgi:hypothetical protein